MDTRRTRLPRFPTRPRNLNAQHASHEENITLQILSRRNEEQLTLRKSAAQQEEDNRSMQKQITELQVSVDQLAKPARTAESPAVYRINGTDAVASDDRAGYVQKH